MTRTWKTAGAIWCGRLKNSDPLTPADEQALLTLTDARLKVLALRDRLRRLEDATLTVAQFHRLAMVMVE